MGSGEIIKMKIISLALPWSPAALEQKTKKTECISLLLVCSCIKAEQRKKFVSVHFPFLNNDLLSASSFSHHSFQPKSLLTSNYNSPSNHHVNELESKGSTRQITALAHLDDWTMHRHWTTSNVCFVFLHGKTSEAPSNFSLSEMKSCDKARDCQTFPWSSSALITRRMRTYRKRTLLSFIGDHALSVHQFHSYPQHCHKGRENSSPILSSFASPHSIDHRVSNQSLFYSIIFYAELTLEIRYNDMKNDEELFITSTQNFNYKRAFLLQLNMNNNEPSSFSSGEMFSDEVLHWVETIAQMSETSQMSMNGKKRRWATWWKRRPCQSNFHPICGFSFLETRRIFFGRLSSFVSHQLTFCLRTQHWKEREVFQNSQECFAELRDKK